MDVRLEKNESKGFAQALEAGQEAGKLTYSIAGKDHIILDHTEVDEAFKGRGVGKKMLFKIVDMARENNIKITPLCPFAAAMFKKIPEIRDVLR